MRKTIVFGNGLGRALDNNFFDLEKALQHAWNAEGLLDEAQRSLIRQCLPETVIEAEPTAAPKSEAELDRLQRVLAACDEISKHETPEGSSWLSDDGKRFPTAIRQYIHFAASYFQMGPHVLPGSFVNGLEEFILNSRSHVATLNYDELLYRSFVGTKLFNGYNCLLDGFVPEFDVENLKRFYPNSQSYYLHLHGSPLYFTSGSGGLHKASMSSLKGFQGYSSTHLVLTHVQHKANVISASPILREYWSCLETAFAESDAVVLFGYGGGDTHLNQLVSKHFHDKQVEIVERNKAEYQQDAMRQARFDYWNSALGVQAVVCFWLEDILTHSNWTWERSKK